MLFSKTPRFALEILPWEKWTTPLCWQSHACLKQGMGLLRGTDALIDEIFNTKLCPGQESYAFDQAALSASSTWASFSGIPL